MQRWKFRAGSLRLRLLLTTTGGVVVISAIALAIDLSRERRGGIERITTSLREQASALQAAHMLIADPDVFRRYVEQLSLQEVADIVGVAVGTVKSRTSRARNELKRRLAAHAREMGYTGVIDEPSDGRAI